MNIKTTLKLSVAAAALFAVATPVASPANAADDTIKSGNKNTLTISGQVVRALWWGDDGTNDHLFNTGGNSTQSRVRWVASGKVNENVTAGALIEMDIPDSNTMNNAHFTGSGVVDETNHDDTQQWSIRHEYVWVSHKKFGKLSLGQTDAAANGNMEANLSGISGNSTPGAWVFAGSGMRFVSTAGASPALLARTVGGVLSNLDFTSRTDVIRYDTPTFMGFRLAVSLDGAGAGEVGGRYSGKLGPVNVVAMAGYSNLSPKNTTRDAIYGGSLALRHDSGLNATFSYGVISAKFDGTDDITNIGFSGGYRAKIFSVGGTDFRGVWSRTKDIKNNNSTARAWGLDAMQHFDPVGATVVIGYRNYDLNEDALSTTIDSIDVIGVQSIFKF